MVNAVVTLIASRSDRMTEICFLHTKATHFETMKTTVDEVNSDKTKDRKNLFFVVCCLIVFVPNSMSKLIHNRCKLVCKLLVKTIYIDAYVYANKELCPCFYVLVCYSLLFSSEIILKQLFASGSVNNC